MNTNTQIDKIDKVLSKISGKEMKAFVWQYAATHEDFATALVGNIGNQSVETTRSWWRLALPMLVCWASDSVTPNWTGERLSKTWLQ